MSGIKPINFYGIGVSNLLQPMLIVLLLAIGLSACGQGRDIHDQLIIEARKNDVVQVRKLSEKGADVNAREKVVGNGDTALFHAAAAGYTDIVKLLIEKGATVNESPGRTTPLMMASWLGHSDTVQVLVDSGANVNAKDETGATALTDAARKGHKDVVQILVAHGADVNVRLADGNTALSWARTRGYKDIEAILIHGGAKN